MDIFSLMQDCYNNYETDTEKWERRFNNLPNAEREFKFTALDDDGNELEITATILVQTIVIGEGSR